MAERLDINRVTDAFIKCFIIKDSIKDDKLYCVQNIDPICGRLH